MYKEKNSTISKNRGDCLSTETSFIRMHENEFLNLNASFVVKMLKKTLIKLRLLSSKG